MTKIESMEDNYYWDHPQINSQTIFSILRNYFVNIQETLLNWGLRALKEWIINVQTQNLLINWNKQVEIEFCKNYPLLFIRII